jgi:hypothetical protein
MNLIATYQRQECLARDIMNSTGGLSTTGALFSPEAMQFVVQSYKSYTDFRQAFEFGPHAAIHNGVGGTMRAIEQSANGL